ncbi:hypothetical protein AN3232.2 [Aspergillus nidulans FGSC A4]|nr:hypothetical protein AN3232.2 [Aspergillus nidulans FGSC A4]|eukprot:XP_660836.1 hypothetical protein AN3232.2 [Aspergillus nidulans FGSC A4]
MWWAKDPETKLLVKIDWFILSFCCVTYFFNYLDRSNLTNAYVSGMEEELSFRGNQLNQINTVFTVGYILGQIPSNLALTYLRPRIFFPAMILCWGCLTMVTAAVHNPQGIMAIRFFLGVAEASTFSGTHFILGSWYTERELGKRSGIFTASGLAGQMFGGFIQTGIHSSLDGAAGLSGWRWLFITWYWWAFVILWVIAGETESFSSNSLLALYMKSHPTNHYSIAQLNNYPTGVPAVGIVSTLFWATLTDFWGVFGAYYWAGAVYACQATFFAWCNDAMRMQEERHRSVVIASMNLGNNAVNAWWSILFYSADLAPRFTRGIYPLEDFTGGQGLFKAPISSSADRNGQGCREIEEARFQLCRTILFNSAQIG